MSSEAAVKLITFTYVIYAELAVAVSGVYTTQPGVVPVTGRPTHLITFGGIC